MANLHNIFSQCRAYSTSFFQSLADFFLTPPPPPPPPPSSSHTDNYSLAEWNKFCKAGLTTGLALFTIFIALFVFSPPNNKDHGSLYAVYLLVVYIGIIISIVTSLYFFNALATNVLNWKIKGFFTFIGTFLFLSCTIRFNLEIHNRYTIYLWFSFIVLVMIIWGCWLNYHILIHAAPVSDNPSTTTTTPYDTPPSSLSASTLDEPITSRPQPSAQPIPSSPLAIPQEVTNDDEIREEE